MKTTLLAVLVFAVGCSPKTGPEGETGVAGPQGARGMQGPTGATGAQGLQGAQGIAGAVGATGPQGVKGNTGPSLVWTQGDGSMIGYSTSGNGVFMPSIGCTVGLTYTQPYLQLTAFGGAVTSSVYTSLDCSGTPYVWSDGTATTVCLSVESPAGAAAAYKVTGGTVITAGSQRTGSGSCMAVNNALNPLTVYTITQVTLPTITPPFAVVVQ